MRVTLTNRENFTSKKEKMKRKDEKKRKKNAVSIVFSYSFYGIPDNSANVTSRTPFFNDTCNGSVSTGGRIADV